MGDGGVKVSAIIVTRGNVGLDPCLETIPDEWDVVIWNNASADHSHGSPRWHRWPPNTKRYHYAGHGGGASDLSVYGRYAAIGHATGELIFVQDDDVVVSDPQAIVDALWIEGDFVKRDGTHSDRYGPRKDALVCNMPPEFRANYPDAGLVGFGGAFHRDLPDRIFSHYQEVVPTLGLSNYGWSMPGAERFHNECDRALTALAERVLVDVPKQDREFASDPDRMWKRANHVSEGFQVLDLARMVRERREAA